MRIINYRKQEYIKSEEINELSGLIMNLNLK